MGRGDKRSFKGKVFKGSHGNTRPRTNNKKKAEGATGTSGTARKK